MTVIRELFAFLGLEVDKKEFKAAEDALEDLEGKASSLVSFMKKVTLGLAAVSGAVAVAAQQSVKAGADAVDAGIRLGITAEEVQQLGYVAEQTGSSAEGLGTSMQKLSRNTGEALSGNKTAIKSFNALGVKLKDINGRARGTFDIFTEVIDKLGKIPNVAERNAKAVDLLGKSGADLAPLFAEGAEGIEAMRQRAMALGFVITNEQAKAFAQMDDDLVDLKMSFLGIVRILGTAAAPILHKVVLEVTAWVLANREFIEQDLANVVKEIAKMMALFVRVGMRVMNFIRQLVEATVGWRNIVRVMIDLLGAVFIYKLLATASALQKYVSAIMMAAKASGGFGIATLRALLGPALLAAAIIVLVLAIEDFVAAVQGKNSVIGRFVNTFLLRGNPDDAYWPELLRLIASGLKGAVEAAREFIGLWDQDESRVAKAQRYWMHFWDPVITYWQGAFDRFFHNKFGFDAMRNRFDIAAPSDSEFERVIAETKSRGSAPAPSFGVQQPISLPAGGGVLRQGSTYHIDAPINVAGDLGPGAASKVVRGFDETMSRQTAREVE